MNDDERKAVAAALMSAEQPALSEIVRQAESFLADQLRVGLASDQRAMTLSAILAAVLAALVGGTASLIAAKIDVWPHVLAVAIAVLFLLAAMIFAVSAARPVTFCYSGSNPRHWVPDVKEGRPLTRSLAEQAAFYSQNIADNKKCLEGCNGRLNRALTAATFGVVAFVGIEFVIVLSIIAKNGIAPVL